MKKTIFILIMSAFLLAGCGNLFSGSKSSAENVYIGTDGVLAQFSNLAPPQTVFENSKFPILITVSNKGAYSIKEKEGVIAIGREIDYVPELSISKSLKSTIADNMAVFSIDGKTQINPSGSQTFFEFSATTGKLDPQSEAKGSTLTATLCYPYQTSLSTTVCIDPDVLQTRPGKKVCTVKDTSFGSGQGAPIAITKIESRMIPQDENTIKPQFLIYLENRAKGNPIKRENDKDENYKDACTSSQKSSDNIWNIVYVNAYSSEGSQNQISCCPNDENGECLQNDNPKGLIRLRDGKGLAKCTFTKGFPSKYDAFTSPLKVVLDYGYTQSIKADFIIQKPYKY